MAGHLHTSGAQPMAGLQVVVLGEVMAAALAVVSVGGGVGGGVDGGAAGGGVGGGDGSAPGGFSTLRGFSSHSRVRENYDS